MRSSSPPVARLTILFVAAMVAGTSESQAQAWTRPAGHAYLKVTRSFAAARDRFEIDGLRVAYDATDESATFRDNSYYLYAEYGLTDRITAVGMVPIKRLELDRSGSGMSNSGIGSLQIGVRIGFEQALGFADDRHRTTISAIASLPTGYIRNEAPSLGPGQADLDIVGAYGISLYPLPAYSQLAAGYRFRSNAFGFSRTIDCPETSMGQAGSPGCVSAETVDFDSEWLMRGEFGVSFGTQLLLQAIVYGTWSNSPPETEFNTSNPIATRQRFTKVGVGVAVYPVPYIGLSLQVFETVTGKNTIDSTDWFVGIEYITDRR